MPKFVELGANINLDLSMAFEKRKRINEEAQKALDKQKDACYTEDKKSDNASE